MILIKFIILTLIFISSTLIGTLISKKYVNRELELKEMKNSLETFKTKIKFTYEPIPEIFKQISKTTIKNISEIFENSSRKMKTISAGQAWTKSLESTTTNMNKEDIYILKNLSKQLGTTDVYGQISQIEITINFLENQIKKSIEERQKNEKLYKTLGAVIGLAIIIILI